MLYSRWIDDEEWYHVCNDHGECLIHTRNRQLAYFVDKHSRGLPRGLYLSIGGDRKRDKKRPLFRRQR